MAKKKPKVFAVHGYETGDGLHRVHSGTDFNRKGATRKFKSWTAAENYARKRAKKLGLKSYMVDTPHRPHVVVKLDKKSVKKKTKKKTKKKKRKRMSPWQVFDFFVG